MDSLIIQKVSYTHCRITFDRQSTLAYENYKRVFYLLRREVPGKDFMPAYRWGQWDGYIEFLNFQSGLFRVGLLFHIIKLCEDYGMPYKLEDGIMEFYFKGIPEEQAQTFLQQTKTHSNQQPLTPRNYQTECVIKALSNKRLLISSPTSSGKSLIIYLITKYLQKNQSGRILILVPTISLVSQLYKDFCDYENCSHLDWVDCSTNKKDKDKRQVFISTWQSVIRNTDKEWYSNFSTLIIDECHQAKAKSILTISDRMHNAQWRFGFSGSIKTNTNDLDTFTINSIFGNYHKSTTTKELIDAGLVSNIKIKLIEFKYRENLPELLYKDEIRYLCGYEQRNNAIVEITKECKNNTLILFQFVELQGKKLFERLKEQYTEKQVFFVYGDVDVEQREEVRSYCEKNDNAIIVASYQTFSTGINIKNLHNLIFASPTKSFTRILQSVGRGLRLKEGKDKCIVYDLYDLMYGDIKNIRTCNYTFKHFLERLKIYKNEGFEVEFEKSIEI